MGNTSLNRRSNRLSGPCSGTTLIWLGHLCLFSIPPGVSPRTIIAQFATSGATTVSAKLAGQVFFGDLLEERGLVRRAEDGDFVDCDGIEPAFDDAPDSGETPWRVDEVEFPYMFRSGVIGGGVTHSFGVVVLADFGCFLKISVDLSRRTQSNALQIHDCAGCFDQFTGLPRTRRLIVSSMSTQGDILPDEDQQTSRTR